MGRSNAVGRAFRISERDVKSYDRVSRPRRMRANPMGVTTLASVNGRGAYASARARAQGQSRAERLARARKLIGGKGMQSNARGHRAAFVSAMRKNKGGAKKSGSGDLRRRGKRLAAYKAALTKNKSRSSAARSALRKVPFSARERKRRTTFAGVKARYRRNRDTLAEQKKYEAGWEETFGKKAKPAKGKKKAGAKKARKTKGKGKQVAKARKSKSRKAKTTKGRVHPPVGAAGARKGRRGAKGRRVYTRAKLYNPKTGRTEYSYMYRAAGGRLRRIPTSAIIGGGRGLKGFNPKLADKVRKARERAAARILKHGDVFTPNRGKKRRKTKGRRGKWNLKRYNKARAAGYTKAEAKKIAYGQRKLSRKRRKGKRRKARAAAPKRRTKRRKSRRGGKRKSAKRVAAGKKAASTRKRRASAKKGKRKGKRRAKSRGRQRQRKNYASNRRRRSYAPNRRRGRKRRRGAGRMKRNAFMANLLAVLKTGALVAVGFASHRVLTALACEYLFTPYVVAPEGKEPNLTLKTWEKPICGAVIGVVGVGALSFMADKKVLSGETAMAIGGGMIASLVQYTVVSALTAADQTKAVSYLSGYSNSMAYSLRGNRRRRALRGIGAMQSIMPRYAPVGQFQQAAAGMGEYFTGAGTFEQAAAGVGEYYVPRGTQGVGAYEPAGPLAMQAAANGIGQIDDGIRPDSNLDRVLDLAESAAGLGEYITASPDNGGWMESTVPTQSQWIPQGPLWAGELRVRDSQATSELPAGVLATVGGNGVLSG